MATFKESDVRMKGYLYKLPVSGGIIKKWSKRWVVLRATSHDGVVRLNYYDSEEGEVRGADVRTVNLRNSETCTASAAYKSHPHAFQFATLLGLHVFDANSNTEMNAWIDAINTAVKEDQARQKSAITKSKRSASAITGEASDKVIDRSLQGQTNPSELMGTYRVVLEQNETAVRLNLTGVYNLEINPRTLTLISSSTLTTIAVWRYQHIKSYAKSNDKLRLQLGRSSPTGAGTLLFNSSCTREMFGVIHRNIKKLRASMEKAREAKVQAEVEQIKASKAKSDSRLHKGLRPNSMVYDVSEPQPENKRASYPIDGQLVELVNLPEMVSGDQLDPLYSTPMDATYDSLGPAMVTYDSLDQRPPPQAGPSHAAGSVDHTYDVPRFASASAGSSLPSTNAAATESLYANVADPDPFANVSDPFSTSALGSFYNEEEDPFNRDSLPLKTSTPTHTPSPQAQAYSGNFTNQTVPSNPFEEDSFVGSMHTEDPPTLEPVVNPLAQDSHNQSSSFDLEQLDKELLQTLNSLEVQVDSMPVYATVDKSKKTKR